MMGSRGESTPQGAALAQLTAAMPPQITALSLLSELVELVKASDKLLPAAIQDLRAAEASAKAAYDLVAKDSAALATHQAAVAQQYRDLEQATEAHKAKEAAFEQVKRETEQQQATFVAQAKALDERKAGLDRRAVDLDKKKRDFEVEMASRRTAIEAEKADTEVTRSKMLGDAAEAIKKQQEEAETSLTIERSVVMEEIARARAELDGQAKALQQQQWALHERAAKLREALGNA